MGSPSLCAGRQPTSRRHHGSLWPPKSSSRRSCRILYVWMRSATCTPSQRLLTRQGSETLHSSVVVLIYRDVGIHRDSAVPRAQVCQSRRRRCQQSRTDTSTAANRGTPVGSATVCFGLLSRGAPLHEGSDVRARQAHV